VFITLIATPRSSRGTWSGTEAKSGGQSAAEPAPSITRSGSSTAYISSGAAAKAAEGTKQTASGVPTHTASPKLAKWRRP
jgi:hypothetical protein